MIATEARCTVATQINPTWLDPASHLAFLDRVFPGQWDRGAYDWYATRAFNGRKSDILVRADGSTILGSMALCYRQIVVDAGPPIDVAVISAAATLPSERGRGHYGTLLQTSLERSREKACAALLAFVTCDNASGRGLVRLGARVIPSFYITSGHRPLNRHDSRARSLASRAAAAVDRQAALDSAFAVLARRKLARPDPSGVPQARFHYERVEDWRRQFIHRPSAVHAVRLAHDSLALVETVRSTDRLQWLACPDGKATRSIAALAAASAAAQQKFFMYTLDPRQAEVARRAGLRIRSGYFTLLSTGHSTGGWSELARASWHVQSGDRL